MTSHHIWDQNIRGGFMSEDNMAAERPIPAPSDTLLETARANISYMAPDIGAGAITGASGTALQQEVEMPDQPGIRPDPRHIDQESPYGAEIAKVDADPSIPPDEKLAIIRKLRELGKGLIANGDELRQKPNRSRRPKIWGRDY